MTYLKKNDIRLILVLFIIGILLLFSFKLAERLSSTGNLYAKVFYKDELILMIDLETYEYKIYDTIYTNQIDVGESNLGIFYVPGSVTSDMTQLYLTDSYARDHQIQGIKLVVENAKISVAYQESPKDICELQAPTNSSLVPIVCLPNELLINISTNLPTGEFIPDAILEWSKWLV